MKSTVHTFLKTAIIVACVVTALPSAPLAQSLDLYIGRDGPQLEYRDRDRDRNYERWRGCSERQAIRRAYRYGMRDPAIQSVSRRSIVVDGIGRRGEYTALRLANREGCPRIG
jgi:tRNA A-37 threonylcarbamoyl transferase component Bud32